MLEEGIGRETSVTFDSSSSTQGTQPKEIALNKDVTAESSTPMTGLKGNNAASVEDNMQATDDMPPCHSNTAVSCLARSGHEEERTEVSGKERKEPPAKEYFLRHINCHSRSNAERVQTPVPCS
jgi:hypothetical protein